MKSPLDAGGPATRTRARRSLASESTHSPANRSLQQVVMEQVALHHPYLHDADFAPSSPSSEASSQENADIFAALCDGDDTIPRVTLVDLPAEIIDHICSDIEDRQDLVHLCLVSKHLHDFASRALYREPAITSRHVAWKLRTATRTRRGLVGQIKVLDLDLVDLCHASVWSSWHLQETGGVILDIMRYCHHLIHFRCQMPTEAAMFWSDFAHTIGTSFRTLQTFYKDIRFKRDPFWDFEHYQETKAAWLSMPDLLTCVAQHTHLHTVAVRGLGSALATRAPPYRPVALAAKLRTLVIVQTSIKERDLLLLMGGPGATSVTKLTLIESTCISKRGLVDALTTCGLALEELTVGPGWWGKSDTSFPIDDVAPKLKHLKRLSVEGDIISPAFFNSTHSHPLHHVRLDSLVVRRCHLFKPDATLRALRDMHRATKTSPPPPPPPIPSTSFDRPPRSASVVAVAGSVGDIDFDEDSPMQLCHHSHHSQSRRNSKTLIQRASGAVLVIKYFYMTHASKNFWTLTDLREASKWFGLGDFVHDLSEMSDDPTII